MLITSSNLTSVAKHTVAQFNTITGERLEIWERDKLVSLVAQFPHLEAKYTGILASFPLSFTTPPKSSEIELIDKLANCPLGKEGWKEFEDVAITILKEVFVPPLKEPKIQAKTLRLYPKMSKHLQKAAYLPTIDVVETIYPKEIRDAYSAYHKTGEWLKEQG